MIFTFLGFDKIEWVQIISALGTFLAAIAAWKSAVWSSKSSATSEKQLNEMKEQRLKTYQPSLAFVDNFHTLSTKNKENDFSEPNFFLYNIGFGAAKEINIKWDNVNHIDYSKKPFLEIPNSSDFVILMLTPFKNSEIAINRSYDSTQFIQYLLPTNIDNKPIKIKVPLIPYYALLYKINNELIVNGDHSGVYSYDLDFSISYKDINNDEYEEKHKINLSFSMFNRVDSELRLNIKVEK